VHRSGVDWPGQNITQTVIQYPAGQQAAAQLVGTVLPGASLQQVKGLSRVRILLGRTDHTVNSAAPSAASTPSATPSQSPSPGQQRTAAQDTCH
jgi:hypothetical protein